MNLNKHSFNREGYNPDMYPRFKEAVELAIGALNLAGRILGSHTSPELEAYKIVDRARNEVLRIHFDDSDYLQVTTIPANRLTPEQWCDKFGVEVVDPDGWRDTNNPRSWFMPITQDMFISRFMVSTTRIVNREKYLTYQHLFR